MAKSKKRAPKKVKKRGSTPPRRDAAAKIIEALAQMTCCRISFERGARGQLAQIRRIPSAAWRTPTHLAAEWPTAVSRQNEGIPGRSRTSETTSRNS